MATLENEKIALKAYPLGVCAGVNFAWFGARDALALDGQAYILGSNMANNNLIVDDLEARGGIPANHIEEIPIGSTVYRTAHGGSDNELSALQKRGVLVKDFTCPLVLAVYRRAQSAIELAIQRDLNPKMLYICKGDLEHREVRGVVDQFRELVTIIQREEEIDELSPEEESLYFVDTQTTMNTEIATDWMVKIKQRIPSVLIPPMGDICFATRNRQKALRAVLAENPDLLLVFGSDFSSNTAELVKIGKAAGIGTHLLETGDMVTEELVEGRLKVAVSGGASVPIEQPNIAMARLVSLGYKPQEIRVASEPDFFTDKVQPQVFDFRT